MAGRRDLGNFNWEAFGRWRTGVHARWGALEVFAIGLGSTGLGHDSDRQTLSGNVGSISGLSGKVELEPAALSELALRHVAPGGALQLAVGRLDFTSSFDANRAANDAFRHFVAAVLENNPSVPFPAYGGLGALLEMGPADAWTLRAGVGQSQVTEPFAFWRTLDDDSWWLLAEVEHERRVPGLGRGTLRLLPWHRRLSGNGGWGVALGADLELGWERLVGFLRLGLGDDRVTPVEHFASGGVSLAKPFGRGDDAVGVGLAWSDPSPGSGRRAETLLELFYRIGLLPHLTLTPDLQLVFRPGAAREPDRVVSGGLRLALRF